MKQSDRVNARPRDLKSLGVSILCCTIGLLTLQAQAPAPAPPKPLALTAELAPFQAVDIVARVPAFVESISVDRASVVKRGDLLAKLSAPELPAQRAEAEAKVQSVLAQRAEVEAKLAAAEGTAAKLQEAAKTPGVVAANDVAIALKAVDALKGQLRAIDRSAAAADAHVKALAEYEKYLAITAPFDGVVTVRNLHPGALAGPNAGALLRLEQVSKLRLVIAVPEAQLASLRSGMRVSFSVEKLPGREFAAVISRPSGSLDAKTRTMAVEADVDNARGLLAPGMYAEVAWPVAAK